MKQLIKIILITCTIVLVGYAQSYNINGLRELQAEELSQNEKEFQKKAQDYKSKGEYNDTKHKELLEQYSQKRSEIVESYKKIDKQREVMIEQTLSDIGDGIDNTGSMPKNVNADVDYVANTQEGYEQVRQKWQERGDNLEIYNHDDPNDYKTVNNSTDEVAWKDDSSLTKAQIEAKNLDQDAYVTTGGKKSTGVRGANVKSSDSGAGLDPMRKLVFGMENNNLKDVGKSLVKITTQADGVDVITRNKKDKLVIQKELDQKHIKNNETLQKASDLKNYKDQYESKIVDLGDTSDVATKKLNDFKKEALSLAVEKQAKLDIANQRKERISEMLIESLPEGSPTKQHVEQRLKDSREANQLAREQIATSLENIAKQNPGEGFDQLKLTNQDQIRQIENTQYQQKELIREGEKNKILDDAKKRKTELESKKTKKSKKLKVNGTGVVSFLVEAYQFEDSADNIIKSGGNEFVTINKNDSQLEKNIKAYTGAAIDSTTFGGAWNAGKRADEEEKKRIQDALKKGKTINPAVSWARASFWGLYYVVKENAIGAFESAKDTLVQIDTEIKEQIKDSVTRKYAKKTQEDSQKLLEEKIKEKEKQENIEQQNSEEKVAVVEQTEPKKVVQNLPAPKELPKRKKVVFFEDTNVNSELAYMQEVDRDKAREASADNARINSEEHAYTQRVIAGRQALASGLQSFATGMAAVKTQMDAQDRAFEEQIRANRENVNQVMSEANRQYIARQNNPNSTMNLLKKEAQSFHTGYTSQQHQANLQKTPKQIYRNTNNYSKPKPKFVDTSYETKNSRSKYYKCEDVGERYSVGVQVFLKDKEGKVHHSWNGDHHQACSKKLNPNEVTNGYIYPLTICGKTIYHVRKNPMKEHIYGLKEWAEYYIEYGEKLIKYEYIIKNSTTDQVVVRCDM